MMVFAIAFDPSCDPSGPGVYSQLWLPRISGPTAFVPNSVRLDGRNDERIGLGDEHGAGGDSSHCSLGPATHPKSPAFVEPRSFYIRRGEIRVDFARLVEGNGEYHHVQRLLSASVMGQRYIGFRFLSGCAEVDVIAFSVCDVYPSDP